MREGVKGMSDNLENICSCKAETAKSTITVYHGSTFLFDSIDVSKGKPYKDFGRGFYITKDRNHAGTLALRNKRIEIAKGNKACEAYLYTFDFEISAVNKFNTKQFKAADMEWIQFVLANRKTREKAHDYDIVIGFTANDDTMTVLNAYLDGLYGEVGSGEALNILLRLVKADKLPEQIYFSCNKATALLNRKGEAETL
ncbi:MAG: DUF3990 domain-containing protein [Treponema sp.]|nr:DUF3990 domain-containing protein [Treponema sp.]